MENRSLWGATYHVSKVRFVFVDETIQKPNAYYFYALSCDCCEK